MPRRPKRTPPKRGSRLLGPYDMSTVGLPGGTEEQALSLGFALDSGRQTMRDLVERSNQLLVQDTANAYIVLQPELNGPLARAVDLTTLRNDYDYELNLGGLPITLTDNQFKHQLDTNKLGMARRQSVFEGVPTQHHWRPTDRVAGKQANIWIGRSSQAKNALPNRYDPLQIRY